MNEMNQDIERIQVALLNNLNRLDNADQEDITTEVARSNAISQIANTYIKSCNLVIRVEESKANVRNKISDVVNNDK